MSRFRMLVHLSSAAMAVTGLVMVVLDTADVPLGVVFFIIAWNGLLYGRALDRNQELQDALEMRDLMLGKEDAGAKTQPDGIYGVVGKSAIPTPPTWVQGVQVHPGQTVAINGTTYTVSGKSTKV